MRGKSISSQPPAAERPTFSPPTRLGTEEKAITENRPFALTGDSFPKIIVRHDIRKRWYDDNGILNIGVIDFLLDDTLV